jgi:hypothetical protein
MPRSTTLRKRLGLAVLATAALAGSAAGAAHADSIAYIKSGDVWLTTTDAARQFQVTGTGGYFSVSQADDGTLVATTGAGALQRLDRYGRILSEITTPVSQPTNGGSTVFIGPLDADVSPDGKTVGYGFLKSGAYRYPDGTMDADLYDGHGFTRSDAATGFLDAGYTFAREWSAPEFLDNSTVLVSNGPGWPSSPFALEKVGSGDPRSWFADPDNVHPMDATISRNRRFVAAVHGPDRLSLTVYRIGDGAIESAPVNRCMVYSDPANVRYESPTISGDGRVLAWGNGHGLYIAPLGDAGTACPAGQDSRDVLPGASQPDWGPADVPASRPADAPLRTGAGASGGSQGGGAQGGGVAGGTPGARQPGVSPAPAPAPRQGLATLTVRASSARLAVALRKGLVVSVTAPAAGRVAIVARDGKAKVGAGAARAARAGQVVRVKVTFTAAARKQLRRARRATLTLTVSAAGSTKAAKVTLKR